MSKFGRKLIALVLGGVILTTGYMCPVGSVTATVETYNPETKSALLIDSQGEHWAIQDYELVEGGRVLIVFDRYYDVVNLVELEGK